MYILKRVDIPVFSLHLFWDQQSKNKRPYSIHVVNFYLALTSLDSVFITLSTTTKWQADVFTITKKDISSPVNEDFLFVQIHFCPKYHSTMVTYLIGYM